MAELTAKERLQPSLLDRLTDDEPHKKNESRDRRVLSMERLRQVVLRDLVWLLNAGHLSSSEDLTNYPFVASSVLNYGMPDLAGVNASGIDPAALEKALRQAIWDFEPRIIRNTLTVKVLTDHDQHNSNALQFEIEGDLWGQLLPQRLYLRTDVDLESGKVSIADMIG